MGRIGVEIATRGETFPLVGEDGRSDERLGGKRQRGGFVRGTPVEPVRFDTARSKLGGLEEPDQKPAVCCPALDHDLEVAQRRDESSASLLARVTARDHLGDQRIKRFRYAAARHDTGIHTHPRAKRCIEAHNATRRGPKACRRVLRAKARLDGDTSRERCLGGQRFSAGDADLEANQIESRHFLGDAMFDLETRVYL